MRLEAAAAAAAAISPGPSDAPGRKFPNTLSFNFHPYIRKKHCSSMADLSTQPPVDDVSDGWVLGLDGGFRLDADPKSRGHHPMHLRQPSLSE